MGLAGTRENVLQELADELGEGAEVLVADLSSSDGAVALAGAAETALDGLDILVNNAGITRDNLALRMKDEDWDAVLSVNLTAGFQLIAPLARHDETPTRAYYRHYIRCWHHRKSGTGNYAASKAGMIGMSKSLAQEVASRGITVNCVAPGFITTPMTDALPEAQRESLAAAIPAGRLGGQ